MPEREWFDKDYYEVLGVSPTASEKEITRAYRKLAKQFHPDANQGSPQAEERFKEISAAYDVLGDDTKRKEYDEVRRLVAQGYGTGGFRGAGPSGFGFPPGAAGFEGAQFDFEGTGLGDLLGNLFGGGGDGRRGAAGAGRAGRSRARRGADLETELHLSFADAAHGVTTAVGFTAEAACSACHGTGAEPGTTPERCSDCGGSGQIAIDQGPFSVAQVCSTCGGSGQMIRHRCTRCRGSGVEIRPRDVKVRIPAGVRDGQRIRVKGRGAAGRNGGSPGDLYVVVHVEPHPLFGRKGDKDLTIKVPITFAEAALGANVTVPALDGPPVTVKVAPGTASGTTVRVRGRGIKPPKGQPGDLLVTFDVAIPKKLGGEERAAVEALAAVLSANPREHLGV